MLSGAGIPKIARRRGDQPLIGVRFAAVAVAIRPRLFGEIGGVGGIGPLVSVLENFAVAVEIIERDQAARQAPAWGRRSPPPSLRIPGRRCDSRG